MLVDHTSALNYMPVSLFAALAGDGDAETSHAATAQPDAPAAEPSNPAGGSFFNVIVMIVLLLVFLWVIFVLPNKSREKQTQKLLDSIKVNDRVLTMSGIIGTVYSIDRQGGEIVLRVDEGNNVKMRFALSSIYFVYNKEAADKAKEEKEKNAKK